MSRYELFAQIDRPALKPLPTAPYQYAEWKRCRVAPDYHVEIADHYYSVPSRLIREEVEARITDTTVEVLHKGTRVASHARSSVRNRHTTVAEHMPSAHRRYAAWTPAKMMCEAGKIGTATIALVEAIMQAKPHPEQGFRACLGILQLARSYGSLGTARSGLPARQRHRREELRLDQVDPAARARQSLCERDAT